MTASGSRCRGREVWAALNDPAVLKQCIPGCQNLEMSSPTEMTATVVFKVGPVRATTFGGKVAISDLDPPNSYRISGEGSGGVAGFAKGGATVRLESETAEVTILHYDVDAQIGGKLAQLGARLIDSTARKLASEFFASLGEVVGGTAVTPMEAEAAPKGWLVVFLFGAALHASSASSERERCSAFASSHGAHIQTSRSSSVLSDAGGRRLELDLLGDI